MKTYIIILLLIFGNVSFSNHICENNPQTFPLNGNDPVIELKVDSLILPLVNEGLISGTILIAKDSKIVFSKGYGLADRENNIANTPGTVFRIGSITKPITAIAIMQLHEKGKLDINDTLNKYLNNFPNGDKITIFNLLTHTSGIPSYDWTRSNYKPQELDTIISWIKELNFASEPGENFIYSNSGYALLSYIIEIVSEKKYEEYVSENIFIPCDMKSSGLLYSMKEPFENMALGYSRIDYDGFDIARRVSPLSRGAGDLYSTVLDLYKLGLNINNNVLLSSESWEKVLTPFKNSYGLGWYIEELHGEKVIYHPGGLLGYMSNLRLFIDQDIIVINLFNSDFLLAHLVEDQLAAIALGKRWKPIFYSYNKEFLDSFAEYEGTYCIDESSNFTLSLEGDSIFFQETNKPKCRAYPYSENSIYIKEINTRIRFHKSEDGTINYVGFFGLFLVEGRRID